MSCNYGHSPLPLGEGPGVRESAGDIAIRVQGVSKCYHLYDAPRDRLKQFVTPRLQRLAGQVPKQYFREFWALKDVSFEVKKGEAFGIIGRNGSGKSTLLQIICGTLSPTGGGVETNGRIAALLELGSGFNPEFTGRENVYLNGAVLGLSQNEIDARFDDIAAFADIGDFIEQPVKTYSSGMVVRLAFAVIAHVDAEILVVDEALAVGDAVFSQKCMRFLHRFMKSGTLIFVSHDSGSVINLCKYAILINKGEIKLIGDAKEVTEAYLQANLQDVYQDQVKLESLKTDEAKTIRDGHVEDFATDQKTDIETKVHFFENLQHSDGWKTGAAEIESVCLLDSEGKPRSLLAGGELICLVIRARANQEIYSPILGFFVKDRLGQSLFGEHTFTYVDQPLHLLPGQTCEARFYFRIPLLPNGDYTATVAIAEGTPSDHVQHHWIHDAVVFKVVSNKLRHGLVGIAFQSVTMNALEQT